MARKVRYKPYYGPYTRKIIADTRYWLEHTDKDQVVLDTLDICHYLGEIDRLNRIIRKAKKHIRTHQIVYMSQYECESNFDNHLLDILNDRGNPKRRS
jgi:hypothetical protein